MLEVPRIEKNIRKREKACMTKFLMGCWWCKCVCVWWGFFGSLFLIEYRWVVGGSLHKLNMHRIWKSIAKRRNLGFLTGLDNKKTARWNLLIFSHRVRSLNFGPSVYPITFRQPLWWCVCTADGCPAVRRDLKGFRSLWLTADEPVWSPATPLPNLLLLVSPPSPPPPLLLELGLPGSPTKRGGATRKLSICVFSSHKILFVFSSRWRPRSAASSLQSL